ncbi:hypothetical protein [Burkholderia pseudomallei]|uniref:hypothetical protein n=1 Tax=Burkholderia pseudomallei TaxID=28450 RepID=UPI0035C915DD
MSVLAGWQRGGLLAERAVWVATGVVLVVSAHLLPTLIRGSSAALRIMGSVLWGASMVTACMGHVTFFLFAQQHAGELRAESVTATSSLGTGRSLTVVMAERATVTRQLAFAQMHRCARDCSPLEARRVTLAARLDALDAEADDIRRYEAGEDRITARRDALLADPVTSRMAALLGVTTASVDLASGLMFAAVLEGVACLLWTVALRPPPLPAQVPLVTSPEVMPTVSVTAATSHVATSVAVGHVGEPVTPEMAARGHALSDDSITSLPDRTPPGNEVTQLARAIAAGHVRPTVADIRRHLGCSQARAAALRRQLADLTA